MFFKPSPLRHQIIRLMMENPVPYRNTDIRGFYLILCTTLFFKKYKSVILNELYYKGLIELRGDINLFIRAKTVSDIKCLNISASLTAKGMAYYRLYIQEAGPELELSLPLETQQKPKLSILR
ncbi:hypothetical protein [Mucilaginibacter arboris]|uniref:Uncharacterized protein n=1 Tax=Mucilaginibacter arboris TaxID=2682090 RepID=A0A7K1STE9_9SPHI|nr:hypothetical protein [Mucilaginibacter arboris]MVN20380.1 hypothetical protein [Mucilaginibacter arboris]